MTPSKTRARRGVWVLAAGSGCGACVQSIQALLAPRYHALLRTHGVRFAHNPRLAEVVLLTGPLSQATYAPLCRLLAAVPAPRALVATGDCAIDGCVFSGSAALVADPATVLDVNIEVAGCPPAPTAILDAIVAASHLLVQRSPRNTVAGQPATPESAISPPTPLPSPAKHATVPNGTQRSR